MVTVLLDVLAFVHWPHHQLSLYNQTRFPKTFFKPHIQHMGRAYKFSQWSVLHGSVSLLPCLPKLFPKLWFSWPRQSCGHEGSVFEFLRALVTLRWRGFVRSAPHLCLFLTLKCYHWRPDCLIGSMTFWCWLTGIVACHLLVARSSSARSSKTVKKTSFFFVGDDFIHEAALFIS